MNENFQSGAGRATNQIELSPYMQTRLLTAFLQQQNIPATLCMTLACGKLLQDPMMAEMAAKQPATVVQVALVLLLPPLREGWNGGQQR